MLHQIFMAKSLTFASQRKSQMIADNIANAQTVGHKRKTLYTESLFTK